MDGHHLIGRALEIERDAHPVGGGRAEIRVELHGHYPPGKANVTGNLPAVGAVGDIVVMAAAVALTW
jgi:hypothetical protein